MVSISLHSFPPSLSVTPHPAIGYLREYLESSNSNLRIQSFYWNQKIITECFHDIKWLKESIVDSEAAASLFRALFGYLLLNDSKEVKHQKEGLDFLKAWGAFHCPNISKDEFLFLVKRLDRYLDSEIEKNQLVNFNIMGCSANLGQEISSLTLIQRIKLQNPSILTILGGMSAQEGEFILKMFPFVDICVYGEGEQTLLEICNSYSTGLQLGEVRGIAWRKTSKIIINPERPLLSDINGMWANYRDYHWEFNTELKMIGIWDSRNCHWGKCTFCHRTSQSKAFRERDPKDLLAEITYQLKTAKINPYDPFMIRFLGSDVRGSNDKRFLALLSKLCNLKEKYQKMTIFMELNPQYITQEMANYLDLLDAKIQFGFEQWNSRILRRMRKPHRIENAIYTLKLVEHYPSIHIVGFNLLCGFPEETLDDVYQTFRNLLKIRFIMSYLYDKNRKNSIYIIPNPVSMNPCIPIGKDWLWDNSVVQTMIDTSPLARVLTYYTNKPLLAGEYVKVHSYMTILNLNNTEFVQRDLLKKYERILTSTRIQVVVSSIGKVSLSITQDNDLVDLSLSSNQLKVLQKTMSPILLPDLQEKLESIPLSVIKHTLMELENMDLLYSGNHRYINTLPLHIQKELDRVSNSVP